jgi:hypothetical protein
MGVGDFGIFPIGKNWKESYVLVRITITKNWELSFPAPTMERASSSSQSFQLIPIPKVSSSFQMLKISSSYAGNFFQLLEVYQDFPAHGLPKFSSS